MALATLSGNPFADATADFFARLEEVLGMALQRPLRVLRPFAAMDKRAVMLLGRQMPLGLTFSCISPLGKLHCGRCNKCAERHRAFELVGEEDPTPYAQPGWPAPTASSTDGQP